MIIIFVSEASAQSCCSKIKLIEKTSNEELKDIGLIGNLDKKKLYKNKFGDELNLGPNYQIFITDKHPNGAGKYQIKSVNINDRKIDISLDFKIGLYEMGATVINQRVLFFSVEPNCNIVSVSSSFLDKKS